MNKEELTEYKKGLVEKLENATRLSIQYNRKMIELVKRQIVDMVVNEDLNKTLDEWTKNMINLSDQNDRP